MTRPPSGSRATELDSALDVGGVLNTARHQFDRERWRGGLGRPQKIVIGGGLRVCHKRGTRQMRRHLLEHREPLADDTRLEQQRAREIAARPRETCDQTRADRVGEFTNTIGIYGSPAGRRPRPLSYALKSRQGVERPALLPTSHPIRIIGAQPSSIWRCYLSSTPAS